jgi:hypothetical protein
MKNKLKLWGIIALVAVIGLSFAACGNGTTDDDDTYTAAIFAVSTTDYVTAFGGTPPTGFTILDGTREALIAKVGTAMSGSYSSLVEGTGLFYDNVNQAVDQNKGVMEIDSGEVTTLMNTLKSKGYGVGVNPLTGINAGKIGIAAAYTE